MRRCYNLPVRLSELGEFGLIDLISRFVEEHQALPAGRRKKLIAGIGDDASAWLSTSTVSLATFDCLTQDVHFSLETAAWNDLGWKALAVSLSDIAAMGGEPEYALVSLSLPDNIEVDNIKDLYSGMIELGNRHRVAIAGGNVSRSAIVSIGTSVFGGAEKPDRLLRRSAARPGDIIAVTGTLGGAAAGLRMLAGRLSPGPETALSLKQAFFRPQPRVAEGQSLSKMGVRAAIDISDGLLADLGHICRASNFGAHVDVERLPISPDAMTAFPERALDMALGGGEDYELLFTAGAELVERARAGLGCPVTTIGKIVPDNKARISLFMNGKPYTTEIEGWQHFAPEV